MGDCDRALRRDVKLVRRIPNDLSDRMKFSYELSVLREDVNASILKAIQMQLN
jgi:hypothetical protein